MKHLIKIKNIFVPVFILLISISTSASSPSCCDVCLCTPGDVWCEARGLTTVPINIPTNTRRLYLFNNKISAIPRGVFSRLQKLETLDLSANQLTSEALKPGVLDNLENLHDLTLSENRLTRIKTGTFAGTPNIYRLYLKDNRIDTIEDRAFDNLTNLVELKLGSNLLTRTPKLRHSPTLRRLCLNNNHLKTLQRNSFANVNLEQLTISQNQINQLPSNVFGAINNMRKLDISENNLTTPPPIIQNMTFLSTLNMSGNNINSIPTNFLKNLPKIKVLDIRGLRLSTLTMGFIPQRVLLNMLDISDNPWTCDCRISWLIEYMRALGAGVPDANQVRCASPSRIQGRQLLTLSKDMYCNTAPTETMETNPRSPERPRTRKPVDLGQCDPMACANGADCYVNASTKKPACRCTAGWKGVLCDVMIAPPIQPPSNMPNPSGGSSEKPKLFVQQNLITTTSAAILSPVVGKNITLTISSMASGETQAKTISKVIVPKVPSYTVRNLEPGTKYNICVIFVEVIRGRTVEDRLCAFVTTKPLTTVLEPNFEDHEDTSIAETTAREHLEVYKFDDMQTVSKIQENGQNSAVSNNDSTIMFVIAGASAGVILIIVVIAIVLFCKRKGKGKLKHSNNNHNCEMPLQPSNGRVRTGEVRTMVAQQYTDKNPSTHAPLLGHNSDYSETAMKQSFQSCTASSQRVATPCRTESLGRNSNSGSSFNDTMQRQTERKRCCSKSSDGYYSDQRDDVRNLTPNGNIQHAPATYGDMPPVFNNREHDSLYRHQGSASLPMDAYVETSFRDQSAPVSVVPVLSSATNVNQYHHGSIATSAINPRTTYGYHVNSPVSMGNYNPPGPSVARPQPVAMHYSPMKQLHQPDPAYLHLNGDIYPNHIPVMDQQVKRPMVKTLAV